LKRLLWALLILGLLAGIAFAVTFRYLGPTANTLDQAARPIRDTPHTNEVLLRAAAEFGFSEFEQADAWEEPACGGVAVYLFNHGTPIWAWYDTKSKSFDQVLGPDQVLMAVDKQLVLRSTPDQWYLQADPASGRPLFRLGYSAKLDESLVLRLTTEACGLDHAVVESHRFTPTLVQQLDLKSSHSSDSYSMPPVRRATPTTDKVFGAIRTKMGYTSFGADVWEERECHGVVVYLSEADGNLEPQWYWYDLQTEDFTHHLIAKEIVPLLQQKIPHLTLRPYPWTKRADGVGARARYLVGTIVQEDMQVWLHLNTATCSLQPAQVQITPSAARPGMFQRLSS
jgi:hypothetical protein